MKKIILIVLVLAVLPVVNRELLALYSEDKIADYNTPISNARADSHNWPEGVLTLVNDPLRTIAWQGWFSGLSNDQIYFVFKIGKPEDVDHLIQQFAKIKTEDIRIELAPGDRPGNPWTENSETLEGASFAIGDQKIMNAWFERLPEVEPGVRKHGVHRYQKPPNALPPTLTLYVDNKFIVLEKLNIPSNISMESRPRWQWNDEKDEWIPPPENIKQFVEEHQAKQSPGREDSSREEKTKEQ